MADLPVSELPLDKKLLMSECYTLPIHCALKPSACELHLIGHHLFCATCDQSLTCMDHKVMVLACVCVCLSVCLLLL